MNHFTNTFYKGSGSPTLYNVFIHSVNLNSYTYNFVERYVKESSLIRKMSLHLLTVSKRRNVSPTLNNVAKHFAINILVGGPGFS